MRTSKIDFYKVQEILLLLLTFSVFLPILVSNLIAIVFLFFLFLEKGKKIKINLFSSLFFVFFLLIASSFFWSINPSVTLHSIPRNLFYILIPIFFFNKNFNDKLNFDFVLKNYALGCAFFSLLFIVRGVFRSVFNGNLSYLFFHGSYKDDFGLVPKELNAVHVSVYISVAFFYFLTKKEKSKYDNLAMVLLILFLTMLFSTNIIFTTLLLSLIYFFFYSKQANKMRLRNVIILLFVLTSTFFYHKTKTFIEIEFKNSTNRGIGHNVIETVPNESHKVTLYEAWNEKKFNQNDFFPGMAFRVYQARLFKDFLFEDDIFWQGYGFNASQIKIEEKGKQMNVFLGNESSEGYHKKNFHNQYLQTFAELGIFGFLILISILVLSLVQSIKTKYFVHIAFTILMISLFLTESFLMRQRGVVFFTLFCSFFMSLEKEKITKII